MTAAPTGKQSPLTLNLGKRIVGFGVGFVAGLAPFLGKMKVPGFSALIELYPTSLQDWLIPLSGILMGMMAVVVEFAAAKRTSDRKNRRWFKRTVVVFGVSFFLLLTVYSFTVVRVGRSVARGPNEAPELITLAVITGSRTVPAQVSGSDCTCHAGQPAERCVEEISLNPANLGGCFGSNWIAFVTLLLVVLYLTVTGSFVAAVGLLILGQRNAG